MPRRTALPPSPRERAETLAAAWRIAARTIATLEDDPDTPVRLVLTLGKGYEIWCDAERMAYGRDSGLETAASWLARTVVGRLTVQDQGRLLERMSEALHTDTEPDRAQAPAHFQIATTFEGESWSLLRLTATGGNATATLCQAEGTVERAAERVAA